MIRLAVLVAMLLGCGQTGAGNVFHEELDGSAGMTVEPDYESLPLVVHAWGDSLTADGAWFPWMPAAWTMVDHGVGGAEWHDRIGIWCREDILGGARGDVAVLFGGTNDVAQGDWDVDITMPEITLTVTAALDAGFAVVVVMPPPIYQADGGPEREVAEMTEYRAALFAEFLTRADVVLADIYTAFKADADPQSLYETDVGANDGVHPWGQDPNFRGRILEAAIISAASIEALEQGNSFMTIKLEDLLSGSATVDWDNTSMTGTTKRVTEAVELEGNAVDVSWQPAWTDSSSVTGAFGVELSNDLATWTPGVVDTDFAVIGPAVSANTASNIVHGALRSRYARLVYTNVSGTGTLNDGVHGQGKRSGQ